MNGPVGSGLIRYIEMLYGRGQNKGLPAQILKVPDSRFRVLASQS